MVEIPLYIGLVFGLTTLATVYIYYKASEHSNLALIILSVWLALQWLISITGFYEVTNTIPPRFALLVLPPLAAIAALFGSAAGRAYMDRLDLRTLTLLHMVRIPVEIVLYWLFVSGAIPQLMTFEGRNFDILSGLTAPIVFYYGFVKGTMGRQVILAWNLICLALLFNIVVNAALSVPTPFQRFGFEQPNLAVTQFPFVWLPCCVVPIVLLSHLVAIRRLWRELR